MAKQIFTMVHLRSPLTQKTQCFGLRSLQKGVMKLMQRPRTAVDVSSSCVEAMQQVDPRVDWHCEDAFSLPDAWAGAN